MKHLRILLVEENRILRESIASLIETQPDMRVVAACDGNTGILHMVPASTPHVILMDLSHRSQNSLRTVRSVHKELPELKVIGMGLVPAGLDIVEFAKAGVSGFIMNDAKRTDFLKTIRLVAKGAKVIPRLPIVSLPSLVNDHAFNKGKTGLPKGVRLTNRERDIVALIVDGLSNKDIAGQINVATHTVKSHVHNILEKLALQSRLQILSFIHSRQDEP